MRKNLKITDEVHTKLKEFCQKHNLKLSDWASSVLLKEIKNEAKKKLSNLQ